MLGGDAVLLHLFCPVCPRALPEAGQAALGAPSADGEAGAAAQDDDKENNHCGFEAMLQRAASAQVGQNKGEAAQSASYKMPAKDLPRSTTVEVRSAASDGCASLLRCLRQLHTSFLWPPGAARRTSLASTKPRSKNAGTTSACIPVPGAQQCCTQ